MTLLTALVLFYLGCTVFIGLMAGRKVKASEDFALAGRQLPFVLSTSAFFATWFGAETILGASSRFAQEGARGIIEDPLGASLCLILVGLVFVPRLYPHKYLSIGDFFREKYGPTYEFVSSLIQALSYFTYTSAQFVALALVLQAVLPFSFITCLLLGSLLVVFYTFWGGMWALAVTDLIQTIVIVIGLSGLALYLSMDNAHEHISLGQAFSERSANFFPKKEWRDWALFLTAWMVMGLGSLPSQDVFQRVMAAKSEKVARRSATWGGILYLLIALLPLYIVVVCMSMHGSSEMDTQQIIPLMVKVHTPLAVQALFFGALLSAILSTASASLLAQSTVIGENLVKPRLRNTSDKQLLFIFRLMVFLVSLVSMGIAVINHDIFLLTSTSSCIVLVTLFIPMVFAAFSAVSKPLPAFLSSLFGLLTYFLGYEMGEDVLSTLWGFLASLLGFLFGKIVLNRHRLFFIKPSKG